MGDRGLKLLGKWLVCRNTVTRFDHDIDLIRILYENPATRKLESSMPAAVEYCRATIPLNARETSHGKA